MHPLHFPGQNENESLEEAVSRLLEGNLKGNTPLPALSTDAIEALYAFGYGFYQSGHYEKSMHFFRLLTLVDLSNRKHWLGLGAAYQMLKQYERALQSYGFAAQLDENDPYAHWHAAECFTAIDRQEQAKAALKSAEITAKRNPNRYHTLLERLKLLKRKSASKTVKNQSNKKT